MGINVQSGLGINQTWQVVTGSRAINTTYTNSTNKPILVCIYLSAVNNVSFVVGGTTIVNSGGGQIGNQNFIVPPSTTYSLNCTTATISSWAELR